MEYWKGKWEKCTERCDFQGLLNSPLKLNDYMEEKRVCYSHRNDVLNGSTFKYLSAIMNESCYKLPSLINLAWHKTLHTYGNGVHTITATSHNHEQKLIPLILDHSKSSKVETLKDIEREIKESVNNKLTLDPSEIWDNFCDSIILWDAVDFPTMSNVPLILKIGQNIKAFDIIIYYDCNLFDEILVSSIMDYFRTVLESFQNVNYENLPLPLIDCLPKVQKKRIEQWNDVTTGNFPQTKRLHHLVEEAAEATPDKLAIICRNVCLTYKEFNGRANQVGHFLHNKEKVKIEQFIALFLDKTEFLLMTILGIWKSGAAYIPIDPAYPDERVKFILEDTCANTIITNVRHRKRLLRIFPEDKFKVKIMDVENLLKLAETEPEDNLSLALKSSQLAYVTYTSGTTGVPKGVYKEHKGVVNSITDLSVRYDMRRNPEVVVLFSAYVFEPFIRQTLIALVNSQLLVVADDNEKLDQNKFTNFLNEHRVTYLNGTASVLQEYDLGKCTTLTKLILVGEELTKARYESLRQKYHGRIMCEYGFTESALVSCLNIFDHGDPRTDRSIGRPLRNVKAYIVNSNLNPVPIRVIGELYIGGIGISRGYMNRDALTKERFLINPFQTKEEKIAGVNQLIYKTGDLARWLENGNIEYIGRNDFQIKLRGNRIEPAEIESVVLQHCNIKKCTVTVKDSKIPEESTASSRHLVGYFVATENIYEEELIDYLEKKLPRYMIPVRMVQVNDIKTNINGKVDLKALPEVEFTRESNTDEIHKPRNQTDLKLIEIWSDALGIPQKRIGIKDDFFRLGGHSITCIQLIAKIRQILNCDVTIENIFILRSIEKLSDLISKQNELKILTDSRPLQMPDQNVYEEILANSLQQGLVYHYLKQGQKDEAYIMQSHYQYSEGVNVSMYKKAWEIAQTKYPSLRLNFKVLKEVYQYFKPTTTPLDWTFIDTGNKEDTAVIENLMNADRENRYNLETGNLFRVYLIKEDDSKYSLVFSYHHIIIDGWSIPILFSFVHDTYKSLLNEEISEPNDSFMSLDSTTEMAYLLSQKYLQNHRNDHLDYWTSQIGQIDQRVNLSGLLKDEMKYKILLSNYDKIEDQQQLTQNINGAILKKLQNFGVKYGVTLHSILQFAWHKVLHVYGSGSHTVVGTTVSGRNIPIDGIENSVGLFINTLPLVVNHLKETDMCIHEAIKEIQQNVNNMNCKSNVELGKLSSGNGELKHSLFDSLFVLEPKMDVVKFLGFTLMKDYEKLDYPLAVIAREVSDGLKFELYYAGELFERQVITDVLELLEFLLHQVASNPEQCVKNMKLILPKQLALMDRWNETNKQFPNDKTLNEVFEEAAESNSNKIALVYEEIKWKYERLNKKANQLANHLRSLAIIKPDDKVALIMKKNDFLILSILGVWKSGASFVPIDPSYPEERIQFILEDTGSKVAIVNDCNLYRLANVTTKNSIEIVSIEHVVKNILSQYNEHNLPKISSSTNLCYVIYTSGTTGQPKGVMTEHRGVVNLHDSLCKIFALKSDEEEVILSFSNFVFDHFVEQMIDALLCGQTLVILNDDMRSDKEKLYKYIKDNKVTYLSGTPSVLSLYEYDDLKSITRIDAVGEDFTESLFKKIRSTFPSGIIINGYGPTETSITTHKRIYKEGQNRINKSIGHQIYNSTCYILNEFGQRVPIRAVGELYLGGIGVGRGYLNRADLTTKVFVGNPFTTDNDKNDRRNLRMYKTGDMARFLDNGEVECLGRNDFQVKVRGLRIELSEIEAIILLYPEIIQCVVVPQNHENSSTKFLVGYYTSKTTLNEKSILEFIQNKLPAFMMPNRVVQIDSIPVTINGKCDTKKLPKVKQLVRERSLDCNEHLNEIQTKLRYIWSELLRLPAEQIGLEDDFFSLGGDSLSITSMTFMINKSFGKVVGVPQVFLHKSIKTLANFISESGHQNKILKIESHFAPTSLAQERLLFIDEMESGTSAFNIPFILKLNDNINAKIFMESLKEVAKRHESLRTRLVKFKDSYRQEIVNDDEFESCWSLCIITKKFCSNDEFDEAISIAENHIFKLDEDLPIRTTLLKNLETSQSYVIIVFHHTCFDGWSFAIFQRDLLSYYYNYLQGDEKDIKNLPELNYHYKEFAVLQKKLLSGPRLNNLKSYWMEKLSNAEQLVLPIDFERSSKFSYSGYEIGRQVDENIARSLKNLAKSMKTSLFSVLTSAFALTLSVYSGQEEILIGSPVSNRMRSEFENVIGFFINILAMKILVNQNLSVAEFIQSVGDEVVTSHVHQDLPLEKLVNYLKIDKDLSRHPLVQVVLNFNPLGGSMGGEKGYVIAPYTMTKESLHKETTAKYDLSVTVTENESGLNINFTFAKMLFYQSTVEGYLESFAHILSILSLPEVWELKLNELNLVCKSVDIIDNRVVHMDYTDSILGVTLPKMFENIAENCKSEIALVYKDVQVTYKELSERSNQLASILQKEMSTDENGNRNIVAIFMDKSEWMVISILGVWKSGSAYVPIDPNYPSERVKFILKDTGVKVVLTNQGNELRVQQICHESNKILIVDAQKTYDNFKSITAINCNLQENDLCYVIYTSGSTGVPKGVMITHRNVVSFRESLLQQHKKNQTVLFLSNFVFDFSIEQIILSIFNWGKLIIMDNDFVFDDEFYTYLNDKCLTYLSGTPSVITALDLSKLHHLQTITVAGEKFQEFHFNTIRDHFKGRLLNAYGVTETTVYNSISTFGADDCYKNSLGTFFKNTNFYLLDQYLRPLPKGAVAELHLSGPCVSQGYLNLDEMNRKFFVPNPFYSNDLNETYRTLYKTGDLVRLKESGELEYLGRNDNQVKIRGFRIELQEIESAVLNYKKIQQCAVIPDGNSLVCVYVKCSKEVTIQELRTFLEQNLPNHMIPDNLVEYDGRVLPITTNGKLDHKAIRDFVRTKCSTFHVTHTVPRNMLENDICNIFSSILGVPAKEIGIDADFFRLGGDSISSLMLAGKVRNQFGMKCNAKNIFENRTVRKLSDHLRHNCSPITNSFSQTNQSEQIQRMDNNYDIRPRGVVPLLPIQKWFFAKNLQFINHWNQTFAIDVPQLVVDTLTKSLYNLVNHHDAFRLRFKKEPEGYVQYYEAVNNIEVNAHQINVTGLTQAEIDLRISKFCTFDIAKGPLYAVVYLHDDDHRQCKIWWTIHHLIVDSVSWRIIKDDLQTLYEGKSLSSTGTSYKEFSLALQNQFLSEKSYWGSIANKVRLYNTKFTAVQKKSLNIKFSLDKILSQRLLRGNRTEKMETNVRDYLLTAVGCAMQKLTNSTLNYINVEGHGREQIEPHLDLSNTVGWFTTMYPLEIFTDLCKDVLTNVNFVKKSLNSVPNNGIGYGVIYGYTNQPCVSFNFLGGFGNSANIGTEWNLCDVSFTLCTDEIDNSSFTVIDITGAYDQGCLKFSIDFRMEQNLIQMFIETFQQTLKEISKNVDVIEPRLPFGDFEAYYEFPSETKSSTTLFILPPGEGGAESYFNNLVPSLKQFNLIVFNNYYLEHETLEITFEELAAMYIKYVKKVQATGPYSFLGWSFGGVLALEICRQLANSGDNINNLFLIDSYLNVTKAVEDLSIAKNTEVIDKINHKYTPVLRDFENMCSKTRSIVLFKASLLNEMHKSRDQYLLYEYFRKSIFNNLDTLIPEERITGINLEGHTHNTWVKDHKQVEWISIAVANRLLLSK